MGIKIAKKEQKLGIRASSTCSLNFDDLRIPAENVIGEEGKGYKVGPIPRLRYEKKGLVD
jgi:short-chain 2-methylacyl-CoA dehydrogenase